MSGHFVITGVPKTWPAGQSPPARLEISDLIKIDDQFSLFVQALTILQKKSSTEGTSHYQMAGIHGFPFAPWEGSGAKPVSGAPSNSNWDGYCTHGSVLFPTWHRPYLACYEQALNTAAHTIANNYPDKAKWTAAADKLRLPFWDWVLRPVPPPEVIQLQTVNILMPSGKKEAFPNPLVSFNFNGLQKQFPRATPGQSRDWTTFPQTVRYPGYPNPVATLSQRLQATVSNRRDNVEHLLYFVKTWEDFSNHTQSGNDTKSSSLEAIHDSIHVLVGAGGHMNDPLVAAFDPIFWLHHCNVDRLFALWQGINPNTWVSPGSSHEGTWTVPINSTEDANTKLTPFWSGAGSDAYWTSTAARSFETLGYTYPDFAGLNNASPAAFMSGLSARIQDIHNTPEPTPGKVFFPKTFLVQSAPGVVSAQPPSAPAAQQQNVPAAQQQSAPAAQQQAAQPQHAPEAPHHHQSMFEGMAQKAQTAFSDAIDKAQDAAHSAGIPIPAQITAQLNQLSHHHQATAPLVISPTGATLDVSKGFLDWTARIRFKKFELRESFAVHIFLKEPPADPTEWIGADGYVGSHYAFVNSTLDQCANCADRALTIDEGFVHLNTGLAKYSGLQSFDADVVEPYLKKEMHWRVEKSDLRTAIPTSELTSLEVSILSAQISMSPHSRLPTQGIINHHPHVTLGRQGGHRPIV